MDGQHMHGHIIITQKTEQANRELLEGKVRRLSVATSVSGAFVRSRKQIGPRTRAFVSVTTSVSAPDWVAAYAH